MWYLKDVQQLCSKTHTVAIAYKFFEALTELFVLNDFLKKGHRIKLFLVKIKSYT